MNITELARKLKVTTQELRDLLPQLGFDIGQRAIKIDDQTAQQILTGWKELMAGYRRRQEALREKELREQAGVEAAAAPTKQIKIGSLITVRELAQALELPVSKVMSELVKNGIMASLNEKIDFETAAIVAEDLGAKVLRDESVGQGDLLTQEEKMETILREDKGELRPRPPVVVVMGHIDHGKTRLLDAIRKTNVIEGEAGGITQHIGAYQVIVPPKGEQSSRAERGIPRQARDDSAPQRTITFIDTPGHEAFTAMRSRGARVADIAILIVAADDGVKPQTKEAYQIIKSAKLPLVVAINKIDKPEASIDRTKQELTNQLEVVPEEWGGTTPMVPISAKFNKGIDDLLEVILLVADLEKENIKANYNREAAGTIIEAHVDKGEGPVATLLVQAGTLRKGDFISIGNNFYGKVRAMKDHRGQDLETAPPSTPVKILGFKIAPLVGDIVEAKSEAAGLERKIKTASFKTIQPVASSQASQEADDEKIKKLNIILKTDVLGSGEAIQESLEKIEHPEVKVNIIHHGLGNVTQADVLQAEATQSLILAFTVQVPSSVAEMAREKKVEIKKYDVIYHLIEEIRKRLEELLTPDLVRTILGRLKVAAIFRKEHGSMIVGGPVTKGKIENNAEVKIFRKDEYIGDGKIVQLQCAKRDVNDVAQGQECGLKYEGKTVLEEGDVLEVYREEKVVKRLEN